MFPKDCFIEENGRFELHGKWCEPVSSSNHPLRQMKTPLIAAFSFGGEGGIRTHVPGLPDHLISSQRRYGHFGTSPD